MWRVPILLLMMACPLAAQNHPEVKLWSLDVTPQLGYRTSMSFTSEPGVDGVSSRAVLDANPSYGIAVGVRYNDEDLIEFRWARQEFAAAYYRAGSHSTAACDSQSIPLRFFARVRGPGMAAVGAAIRD